MSLGVSNTYGALDSVLFTRILTMAAEIRKQKRIVTLQLYANFSDVWMGVFLFASL